MRPSVLRGFAGCSTLTKIGIAVGLLSVVAGCGSAATQTTATSDTTQPGGQATAGGSSTVLGTTPATTTASSTTAASSQPAEPTNPATITPKPGPSVAPRTTVPSTSGIDPTVQPLIDLAITDLATRLNIDPSTITTVSARTIEWPDGSLGCPAPGVMYIQQVISGAQIELQAGATMYSYHSGGSRQPFLCENKLQAPPTTTGG